MNLQLESPPAESTGFGRSIGEEGFGDLELPCFAPRTCEILQTLNDLLDEMSGRAAVCFSE